MSAEEEPKYLDAATDIGPGLQEVYRRALEGIRAVKRGEELSKRDVFLLRDVAVILIDCGRRPEECFRLTWQDSIRDGAIEIPYGQGIRSR